MENMEKKEEKEIDLNEIDVVEVSQKKEGKENPIVAKCKKGLGCLKDKIKSCRNGECKCEHKKLVISVVVILLILTIGFFGYKMYREKVDIGSEAVKAKVEKFLGENVPATSKVEIGEVVAEGSVYKIDVKVDANEIPIFVTKDGSKLMQAQTVIDLNKPSDDAAKQAQEPEKTEAEVKAEVPVVDLFVMSYCPYGLQMERGILPAVEALGSKIKFNLKFVSYNLHGQKEADENANQYCVQKVAPTKLSKYLQCFWKDSKTAATGAAATACMKTVGINATQVASCVKTTKEQFTVTEKVFDIDKEENAKFGVQGSPTLVINGTKVASGRDSASVLKAICSGFETAPKECESKLSATSPAAGFTDEALAGGASAAACGN
ncbi:MAG: hypothetical protein ACD_8C00080G0003 [uncultured bacterium]|nr:MAG: hypothetical protein ACD_8C00080G0003 [uncultured bacterium]